MKRAVKPLYGACKGALLNILYQMDHIARSVADETVVATIARIEPHVVVRPAVDRALAAPVAVHPDSKRLCRVLGGYALPDGVGDGSKVTHRSHIHFSNYPSL